ncbi:MAG: helix-turn-helix domain-containing protein [Treponema sp.]|nr:helix-turn-helix domain-containing protein [Treponema sp.]
MKERLFWNRIKNLMKNKKVTQETISKACGISVNTWRGWNSKNIAPTLHDCAKIAKYLDVSIDFLVTGKEQNSQVKLAEIRELLDKVNVKLNALQ